MNTGTPAPADLPGALETAVAALAGARLTSIDWTPPAAWGPTAVRLAFDTGHSVIVDNDATLTGADVQALADLMACRPGADLEARPEPGVVGILTRHQVIEVLIEARAGRLSGTTLWAWAQAMLDCELIRFEPAAAGDLRAALRALTDPEATGIRSTDDLADMIAPLGTDPAAARAVRPAWLKFAQSLVLLLLLGALIVAVSR